MPLDDRPPQDREDAATTASAASADGHGLRTVRSAPATILVVLDPRLPASVALIAGLRAQAPAWRLRVNLWDRFPGTRMYDGLFPPAALDGVDGVVGFLPDDRAIAAIRARGLPVVNLSSAWLADAAAHVVLDGHAVGRLAGEHLRGRGFARSAFFGRGGPGTSSERRGGEQRWLGFAAAAGGDCRRFVAGETGDRTGVDGLVAWLRAGAGPAGILAGNDAIGRLLLDALAEAGVRVPLDAAVVGVDDERGLCQACLPPLSSIAPPYAAQGRRAAAMLMRLLAGEPPPPPELLPPLGLEVRASSDVIAAGDALTARALRWIHAHAERRVGIEDLCRAVAASRRTLERRLLTSIGIAPGALLSRLRHAAACRRLLAEGGAVRTVARACGFRSATAFDRAFRRAAGCPPGRWRARNQG